MDLLLEAVAEVVGPAESLAKGELRRDLVAISTHLAEMLTSDPVGSDTASMILESRRDASLDELWQRFVDQRKRGASEVIRGAVKRGVLPAETDIEAMVDDLAAPLISRALVSRVPVEPEWIEVDVDHYLGRCGARRRMDETGDAD